MKDLEPYLVAFNPNGTMKLKQYLKNHFVRDEEHYPVIIITNDKCTFSTNDSIPKAWNTIGDILLRIKICGQ